MTTERPAIPIIRTKLYRPSMAAHILYRERLHAELERGRELPITLVSAPAGYGKSTLVSHWLENADIPSAWLSLDETDSDPRTFLSYFVSAVRTVEPQACPDTMNLLNAGDFPDASILTSCLGSELDAISTRFALVLDDYHLIHDPAIHELLANLLKHPTRSVHLVIVARRNPPLPLASLRARGVLNEIRVRDLQFRAEETGALIERDAGCRISRKALSHVQKLTEGWAVGLRLVALSLRGRDDADAHLCEMRGDIHGIQDYLLAEVLSQQPPRFRDCLLRTAILDRFCMRLCEAILNCRSCTTGCSPTIFIGLLEQTELFMIRLDDQGKWYRHHHLFQELLHRQLIEQVGEAGVAALHMEASAWFESEGLLDEALRHALDAGNAAEARKELTKAVRLAQPGGFIRALVDLGPAIARMLSRLELDEEGLRYVGRILAAFKGDSSPGAPSSSASTDQSGLASPLSKRELEVLALLARRLSNKEIAGQLHISPETVRRHASTIYSKLGVHGRRHAAEKAISLAILPPS